MKSFALIPARGGSKGLPGKNIKLLNGIPLIGYTLESAKKLWNPSDICVSTDDPKIIDVTESFGVEVPFVRPTELAQDDSTTESVILHAIDYYKSLGKEYDFVVVLQPTSPLRTAQHIKGALMNVSDEKEMIVSVFETASNPYYVLMEEGPDGNLHNSKEGSFSRRQDCPKVYELNGAIYVINIHRLREKGLAGLKRQKFLMSKNDSIDIDDESDFKYAEWLLKERQHAQN